LGCFGLDTKLKETAQEATAVEVEVSEAPLKLQRGTHMYTQIQFHCGNTLQMASRKACVLITKQIQYRITLKDDWICEKGSSTHISFTKFDD